MANIPGKTSRGARIKTTLSHTSSARGPSSSGQPASRTPRSHSHGNSQTLSSSRIGSRGHPRISRTRPSLHRGSSSQPRRRRRRIGGSASPGRPGTRCFPGSSRSVRSSSSSLPRPRRTSRQRRPRTPGRWASPHHRQRWCLRHRQRCLRPRLARLPAHPLLPCARR